ncbi:hypothetical protein J2Z31_003530 [Sinorhizobium kostiense]|uniref:Uncharacterized protein n=1 Tax=Sinorhizobium kostiense TaxID=76747 RepID=A0ABS4R2A7_9HYPH|nr:hypothetical protein [Sinorhizobium kostiense]MBP2237016.1 hypothetical protein [Sinorhizobium kostiense]
MRRHVCMSRLFLLSLAVAATLSPSASSACGYHDDVSMARGLLNWVYPDALHVLGSISTAVAAHRLPPPDPAAGAPDLFGAKYRKTLRSLERLGRGLGATSGGRRGPSVSVVLIEPMLWARFEPGEGGLRTRVHATGPEPDDVVLVSGEAVIDAIARGRLTIGEAHRFGLVRLYGSAAQQVQFLLAYDRVGREPPADTVDEAVQSKPSSQQTIAPIAAPATATAVASSPPQLANSHKGRALACGPGHH